MGKGAAMINPVTSEFFAFALLKCHAQSVNRQPNLFSIVGATDIHGSKFDNKIWTSQWQGICLFFHPS